MDERRALARWRLVLGQFANRALPNALGGCAGYDRMDSLLDYLYGREYARRKLRAPGGGQDRSGGLASEGISVPEWVTKVRELFPRETVELIERHALERYEMTELVTDPEVLRKFEPSYELLKTVLAFRHLMQGEVLELARRLVRKVAEELRRKLESEIRRTLWGRLSRQHRSPLRVSRNLDVRRTIRDNLKNYQPERRALLVERLHFFSRVRRHNPWHILMAVDCSGSMMDSVIHSAVMAGIFHALPSLRLHIVAFDTRILDLTDQVADPTELLMSVQLGGGTLIARALDYCEGLVSQPHRTILILVTDFEEGGPPGDLVRAVRRLAESGVRVLGLAALDPEARPIYDRAMAQRCADAGAEVAALTPLALAEWLGKVIG
ncbi:MAG: VWA domain-containing protein [Armatimonadetes bacterium]|nr:VWA domain-containing protein [Armatimonadota bacterium]